MVVAKKWKEFNGTSVTDFFFAKYGKGIGIISTVFLLMSMAGFSATYLKSITILISQSINDSNNWIVSAYLSLITLVLVIRKGLSSIVKMDRISFIIVMISLPIILYCTSDLPNQETEISIENILDNKFIISLFPLTMFSYILAPWYGQRIFAAKNKRVAITSVLVSSIVVFILYSFGIFMSYTLAIKGIVLSDPQNAIPFAIRNSISDNLVIYAYILMFLISSTTLTGIWNSMTNIVMELNNKKTTDSYISTNLGCALVTYILANYLVDNILNKMILANIPVIALSFALLSGFYTNSPSRVGAYVSIFTGLLFGIGSYIIWGDEGVYTYYWAFLGIPAIFISGYIATIISKSHSIGNRVPG